METTIIEIARLIIRSYYSLMKISGMNEDEQEALFQTEYRELVKRDPIDLPDVDEG